MPMVDQPGFRRMIDAAFRGGWAYPAVNVHEIATVNAAIEGFAEARSDGMLQVYPDVAAFVSGDPGDLVSGAITLAEHARRVAAHAPVGIALHTDHCGSGLVESFLRPLVRESARRIAAGQPALFTSHMFDGSDLPLSENLARSRELLDECAAAGLVLEVEVGVVGSESIPRDRREGEARRYTTPDDFLAIQEALAGHAGAELLVAPAFGNVHGVYRPGEVVLRPDVLEECQRALVRRHGPEARFRLVFHGGSGSSPADIRAAVAHGVVKMNVDTDTQYAFTRGVVDHMLKRYDTVLRLDGDVGRKMDSFAETWLRRGMATMRARVVELCGQLGSAGRSLGW
jgi:fructose-bisphosphate aldolase, class II